MCVSVALDAILHGPSLTSHRRHSVSVCQTPTSAATPAHLSFSQKKISIDQAEDDSLQSSSSLCSSQRSLTESGVSSPDVEIAEYSLNTPAMHANLHTEFIHSVSQCQTFNTAHLTRLTLLHYCLRIYCEDLNHYICIE